MNKIYTICEYLNNLSPEQPGGGVVSLASGAEGPAWGWSAGATGSSAGGSSEDSSDRSWGRGGAGAVDETDLCAKREDLLTPRTDPDPDGTGAATEGSASGRCSK